MPPMWGSSGLASMIRRLSAGQRWRRWGAVLIAAASLEVRSQVLPWSDRRTRSPSRCRQSDLRLRTPTLVVFVGSTGISWTSIAQLDVRAVVVDVLNDGAPLRGSRPPRGGHHVVVALVTSHRCDLSHCQSSEVFGVEIA